LNYFFRNNIRLGQRAFAAIAAIAKQQKPSLQQLNP